MNYINKNNYQAFILDYYEGSLSAEKQAELLLFIENNPGLKSEFENFELTSLSSEASEVFPDKSTLLKETISRGNINNYLIGQLEGDLSKAELSQLSLYLEKHPGFKKDQGLFRLTKLQPDLATVISNKKSLKHPVPINRARRNRYYAYAVAASIIMLIGAFYVTRTKPDGSTQVSQKNTVFPPGPDIKSATAPVLPEEPVFAGAAASERDSSKPAGKQKAVRNVKSEWDQPQLSENTVPASLDSGAVENPDMEERNHYAYVADFSPELVKHKLAQEISNDPASFNSQQFEAFLDRVIDSDSVFTVDEFKEPVFAPTTPAVASSLEKSSTPLLNALAWGISKITDEVALKKNFDNNGELVAYRFEAGKLKFGKQESE